MADTDSTLEVQKAIVSALKADAGVSALVGARVYDRVPVGAAFPFVSLGTIFGQPAIETVDGEGFELALTLHFWSRAAGRVETGQAMAAVVAALNDVTLSLDSKTAVLVRLSDQRVMMDDDGVTAHGVQRWRIITDS